MSDITILKKERYIKVDLKENNNKYWEGILYSNGVVETIWGRVGDNPQKAIIGRGEYLLESKIREKIKKGYVKQMTLDNTISPSISNSSLLQVAKKEISSPETEKLIEFLVKKNIHNIIINSNISYHNGIFKTPLGIVTKEGLEKARSLLLSISNYVSKQDLNNSEYFKEVQNYLSIIPQKLDKKASNSLYKFSSQEELIKQTELLDNLEASLSSIQENKLPDVKDSIENLFNITLTVAKDTKEINRITDLYIKTLGNHTCRNFRPKIVYEIDIKHMAQEFLDKENNIWDLWHGTKSGNLLSIMKKGFIIPPYNASYCTGRMFGNGIYFSDQSTKSLNYSTGYWSGDKETECFMFLCKVAMGNYYVPKSSSEQLPKPGYDSTFAEAKRSGVLNNEMIVYNSNRVLPVYLIHFTPEGN